MGNVEIDKRITCDVLFCDRRKIKKLKRKKHFMMKYGEYSISHSFPNFPSFSGEIIKILISDYPDNGCLIIPISKKKIKHPIKILCDNKVKDLNSLSRLFYKKIKKYNIFYTVFMFDNKSELLKWKLKHD